jgi:two-component system, chemotaxis family, sensor kinase CheA
MDLADKELVAEFVVESQEGLANIEAQMLAIEAAGADVDTDLVNAVFRTMHSIKGAAGFFGLDRIGTLAHSLEEILNNLRNRDMTPTSELVTTMLRAADYMKGLLDAVESSNEADVSHYVQELQAYLSGEHSPAGAVAIVTEIAEPITSEAATVQIGEALREFLIECYDNLDQMERDLLVLEKSPVAEEPLRNVFRTIHTIKGGAGFLGLTTLEKLTHVAEDLLGKLRSGERTMSPLIGSALFATVDKCREGLQLVEKSGTTEALDPQAVIKQLEDANQSPIATLSQNPAEVKVEERVTEKVEEKLAMAPVIPTTTRQTDIMPTAVAENAQSDKNQSSAGDSTIRVDVALLDKLMTRVGELVLARNQLLQFTNGHDDSNFVNTAQRLNLITTELQEGVMKTRMQPIGNVWSKFPRVVRDLSGMLNKKVRIEMEGKETELDKTIVEAIKDPLTHLVRNSVDHGIESPEVRKAAGKPEEGRLLMRAYHEGGQVIIEIIDDGAGLNVERIRNKAIQRGLVTPEAAARMSEREAAQLILLPGFSTAEQVTAVSGRGVGMDVVKTNIERISGTMDVQSKTGHGTTVKIKIPLTLAIVPALIVSCDGERYAIPQVSLLELVRLEGEQIRKRIEQFQGAPVYRLRGKLLPIVYLRKELGLEPVDLARADSVLNIVVLRAEDREFGLVVDSINDTEEIVVKPLSKQFKGIGAYAGATIMGDGKVALILDVLGTAHQAHVVTAQRDHGISDHAEQHQQQTTDRETMLLLSIGERRIAMPISLVERLEEVPRSRVEISGNNREVVQYRGEIMPLVRLSEVLGIPTQENPAEPLQVVVYKEGNRTLGFVVDKVTDITEIAVGYATQECQGTELLASAVIQERVTDLLDLPSIIQHFDLQFSHGCGVEQQLAV